jgi:diguanylate cyclase (GGDEF)-like protein
MNLSRSAMRRRIRELESELASARGEARTDPLTGLPNRRAFGEELVARETAGELLCLVFVDIDGFKAINDTLGHKKGDRVLCDVADVLRSAVRPGDMVARLGGDEFAILLRRVDTIAVARRVAVELTLTPVAGVSLSAGVAIGEGAEATLEAADHRAYETKRKQLGSAA